MEELHCKNVANRFFQKSRQRELTYVIISLVSIGVFGRCFIIIWIRDVRIWNKWGYIVVWDSTVVLQDQNSICCTYMYIRAYSAYIRSFGSVMCTCSQFLRAEAAGRQHLYGDGCSPLPHKPPHQTGSLSVWRGLSGRTWCLVVKIFTATHHGWLSRYW